MSGETLMIPPDTRPVGRVPLTAWIVIMTAWAMLIGLGVLVACVRAVRGGPTRPWQGPGTTS